MRKQKGHFLATVLYLGRPLLWGTVTLYRVSIKGMSWVARIESESFVNGHQIKKCTGLGKRVIPRLRELAPRGQRKSGGGIHAT